MYNCLQMRKRTIILIPKEYISFLTYLLKIMFFFLPAKASTFWTKNDKHINAKVLIILTCFLSMQKNLQWLSKKIHLYKGFCYPHLWVYFILSMRFQFRLCLNLYYLRLSDFFRRSVVRCNAQSMLIYFCLR